MELIEANAEDVPLPDESFDLALSEYGASIWCDPVQVDPGGGAAAAAGRRARLPLQLGRSACSALRTTDGKVGERLVRPQFGMHRIEWTARTRASSSTSGTARCFDCLRDSGFEVEGLWEIQASESAEDHRYYDFVSAEWARKWPAEEIWKARKRG